MDSHTRGLGLRVGADSRVWVFSYSIGGKVRVMRLGDFDEKRHDEATGKDVPIGLKDRRDQVDVLRGKVSSKVDPLAERRRTVAGGSTFADLVTDWLKSREAAAWRPKTRFDIERFSTKYLTGAPLGKLAPAMVTRAEIRKLLDSIESDSVADHVRAYLRMLFSWASEHERISALPLFPKRRKKYEPRERVLMDDELRRVWAVLEGGELGLLGEAFKLMLLTSQRRGEVLGLRWSEISMEGKRQFWTLPGERTKNGEEHRVPLCADARAVLEGIREKTGELAVAFPSPKDETVSIENPQKAAERLWEKAKVEGATIHDLRRTAATAMGRAGIPDANVARVLNHSGIRDGAAITASTYNLDPRRYDDVKRLALETWERALRRILSGKTSKVVSITAGKAQA